MNDLPKEALELSESALKTCVERLAHCDCDETAHGILCAFCKADNALDNVRWVLSADQVTQAMERIVEQQDGDL